MSRDMMVLHPVVRERFERVLAGCRERGVELLVTCTLRTLKEQEKLYAQGRTSPGKIVTYARPGQSPHNFGLAVDVVPVLHGKLLWDAKNPAWKVYGEEVRKAGLEWAGDWKRFREYPHCQLPDWKNHR